jgi:hypothetical protein
LLDLHGISQDAFDKVIGYEVTSRQAYERCYQRLTWPKEQSGATGAIGYDFGQATKAQVKADWGDVVDARTLKALLSCCGVTGVAARALVEKLHDVVAITWNDALDVFSNRDLPRYTAMCRAHLPGYDGLSPHCKGVLFSLVMNRGPSFDLPAPRYAEIREIKAAIKSGRRDRGRPARDQRRRFFRLSRACRLPPGRRQMRSRRVTCRDHKARGRARREGPAAHLHERDGRTGRRARRAGRRSAAQKPGGDRCHAGEPR